MYTYKFRWPVRTYVGSGIIHRIGALVQPDAGRRRALIASAADAWCQPLNGRVQELLLAAGYEIAETWSEIEPNPSWETVRRGAAFCQAHDIEVIFAIGGGSTLDASKVMAMEAGLDHVIAVPTTAGTGSELNAAGIITDTQARNKEIVHGVTPSFAILDAELTLTMPPLLTLLTGIDAFCHAVECYVATDANPIADSMALMAMELVARWLQRAVEHGDDLQARTALLEASMLGGGAMLGAGLGLMHGIGHPAGGLTHDAHGLVLARLLDPVLAFNAPAIPAEKLARMKPFVDALRALRLEKFQTLNVPEVMMREQDLPELAEYAFGEPNSKVNPRPYTREDIVAIARKSFQIV